MPMTVQVVLAMPRQEYLCTLELETSNLPAREIVRRALRAGLLPPGMAPGIDPESAPLGVYGERVDDDHICQHGDRLEIYRPLQQDPRELRRQRARQSSG